jgi:hypothetical protein
LALALLATTLGDRPAHADTWQGVDIGAPGVAGSETWNNGVLTITGGGAGVFGAFSSMAAGDPGHLTYQFASGDVEIVARVQSFTGGPKSQIGLMLRESPTPQSDMATTVYQLPTVSNGYFDFVQACRRPGLPFNPAAYNVWSGTRPPIQPPFWLKLVRIGGAYATYRSSDGFRWCPIQNYAGGGFTATGTILAGIFISGGANGASATAVVDSIYLGPPRLEYQTTWVGNSFSNDADRYVSNNLGALYVAGDGTVYTNSGYDEAGEPAKIYKDGRVVHSLPAGSSGVAEGSITSDGQYLYIYEGIRDGGANPDTIQVVRTGMDGSAPVSLSFATTATLGRIGGMAAGNGRIYFSDVVNNQIRVVDAATLTELPGEAFAFTRPGPMAMDSLGRLWIIQRAADSPLGFLTNPSYAPAVRCFLANGTDTGRAITDVTHPIAICYDAPRDRLLVCDNGALAQNVRIYTDLAPPAPIASSVFGTPGGVFTGGVAGLINDGSAGGFARLYGPNGIGVDAAGNLYVSCAGIGSHLRKFTPAGALVWSVSGFPFTHCPDFDPTTDGQDLYWQKAHFGFNPLNTAPGSEWSYAGLSWNPMGPDTQDRPGGGAVLRRFGDGNDRFMFTMPEKGGPVSIYRYSGELAIPCGRVEDGLLWVDLNGDGLETPNERSSMPGIMGQRSFDVDDEGDIYTLQAFIYDWAAGRAIVRRLRFQGLSPEGVPLYSATEYEDRSIPSEMAYPSRIRYHRSTDTMTILGFQVQLVYTPVLNTLPGRPALAVYTNWSQPSRTARFFRLLPTPETDPNFFYFNDPPNGHQYPSPEGFEYFAMDAVGDKIFVGELWGNIHVYDAFNGNPVTRLLPGAEVSGVQGWIDIIGGVRAIKRSTGEYLVVREDAGYRARNLLFRWTPQATAPPQAPVNLAAAGGSDRVRLTWEGGFGPIQKYAVWRGLASGTETLLADNVTAPQYEDTTVQFGVPYYYRVTASNAAGTSGFSNEVVATANTSAAFARLDTTTYGTWKGTYGTQGYTVVGDSVSYPANIQVTPTGHSPYLPPVVFTPFPASPTDTRALQKGSGSGRIAAIWHQGNVPRQTQVEINLTDGQPHQVALYTCDWHGPTTGISMRVDIYDAFGVLLDSRSVPEPTQGKYLVWTLSGHVRMVFVLNEPQLEISGIFIDPPMIAPPAPTGLTAAAGTGQVQLNWTGSAGATSYRVYRSTTSGGPYQQVAGGLSTTSYLDTTPEAATTYYYAVTAANAGGESPYSSEATATTPASPVTINPGSYGGRWVLFQGAGPRISYSGVQVLPLTAGTYAIDNGNLLGTATASSTFSFQVDNAGNVSNISNPLAATASGATLTFNNATIQIQPVAYTGRYTVNSYRTLVQPYTGPRSIVLIPGLLDSLDNTTGVGNSGFSFVVADAAGTITQISNAAAATATGNTLTFNNVNVTVDPQGYAGLYRFSAYFVNSQQYQGVRTFVLIPALTYDMVITGAPGGPSFTWDINGAGVITSISNSSLAYGIGGTTLYFNNDTTPPTTTATVSPAPNANGWNDSNVSVGLDATDNSGGSGVKQITYSATGAQPIASTTVNGASATVPVTAEGETTLTFSARDNAGNNEAPKTITVRIDKTSPMIACPPNQAAMATSLAGAAVNYPAPTVSDNFPGVTVVSSPPSGSTFPIGRTTVTSTATDVAGNESSCTFTVSVSATLAATKDAFLREGHEDTNEGACERLRIQSSGDNRAVVAFNLAGIPTSGLVSATLVLDIAENSNNWGPSGRPVDAHRLLVDWTEGNGRNTIFVGGGPTIRGTGPGVTWHCATDDDISNQKPDSPALWNGGTFAAATAPAVLHQNGFTGAVSWEVTADILAGASFGWVIKKQAEGQNGQVRYYSREGAALAGNPGLAPRLILNYGP